jgi:hypothetical protein
MTQQLDGYITSSMSKIDKNIIVESAVLVVCYLFELAFALTVIYLFYSVYNEKVKVLRIFLGIPEHQILLFSSKSERFLTNLHV